MELLDQLARTDIDPATLAQVRALIEQQQAKISKLTQELAYLRRIRYGKASEVLTGEQRDLLKKRSTWIWQPSNGLPTI